MNYLYSILWFCTIFFLSCNEVLPDAEEAEGEIEIFPDYKEVTIPCNIAPLNFKNLVKQLLSCPVKVNKYVWIRIMVLSKSRRRNGIDC